MLLILLAVSVLAISPSFSNSVVITSVAKDSDYYTEGVRVGQQLISLQGTPITSLTDYQTVVHTLTFDTPQRIDVETSSGTFIVFTNQTLSFGVAEEPHTRLKTGLDLRGGARALLQPEQTLSASELDDLIAVSRNRFNAYGLSDVVIKAVRDLEGNSFMLVEIAGATPEDLKQLLEQQGKFEGKIANQTAFTGGKEDITGVCRNDATCAGIQRCIPVQGGGSACEFMFSLYLTPAAAARQAALTGALTLDSSGRYLSEPLDLYIDDKLASSLSIGASLRGKAETTISIQGSGTATTEQEAYLDAKARMKELQTILITGSLPYKLSIVKLDTIAPLLGDTFTRTLLLAGFAAIVAVSLVVFIRYRAFKASLAILFTSFSEIVIILGFASFIGWNLDLPSIAGILATIGTGVDQQIIILDEARKRTVHIGERMKRAFFIVMSAFATAAVSLLPLYWAGAGLFKGFMITTLVGITAGVLLTRPAFADMIRASEEA